MVQKSAVQNGYHENEQLRLLDKENEEKLREVKNICEGLFNIILGFDLILGKLDH